MLNGLIDRGAFDVSCAIHDGAACHATRRTDGILERHWLAVKMLGPELRDRGVVRRDRAQDILDRWMPVRGGSMLEALGYQQPVCQYVTSTAEIPQ